MIDNESQISELRQKIDSCDRRIIEVLAERFEVTQAVGEYKAKQGLPARDPKREEEKFQALAELARTRGLSEPMVRDLFERIIEEVRSNHRKLAQTDRS